MMSIKNQLIIFIICCITTITTYSQIAVPNVFSKLIILNKTGYPYYITELDMKGYASLFLRTPKNFKNISYPTKLRKTKDTAIAEISSVSLDNPNITQKFYLLVFDYKSKHPTIFLSEENSLHFNNKPIIDSRNKKYNLSVKTKKGALELLIDYSEKLNGVNNYIGTGDSTTVVAAKYALPIWIRTIRYGSYLVNKDSIYFAISDENQNGVFNEYKQDRIAISNKREVPFFELYETSSSTLVNSEITLSINSELYSITSITDDGTTITIEPTNFVKGITLKLFNGLTDASYINSKGDKTVLNEVLEKGKYSIVYFWIKRCTECEEDLKKIDSISLKLKNKLTTLCLLDKSNTSELVNTITKLNLTSNQGTANLQVARDFHLSGYPSILLFDRNGLFIKKIKKISEIETEINKNQ
jgi:hypothetical protein